MSGRRLVIGLAVVGALGLAPRIAGASTIPANSASHDTSFDISYQLVDDTSNIYKFYVTATYGSNLDYTYINDIAFKLDDAPSSSDYDVTPPTVVGPAEDSWAVVFGGVSNSSGDADCSGTGGGFWCADSAGSGATHGAAGTTDTWTFTLNLNDSLSDLPKSEGISFKAGFTDASGNKVGSILSTDVNIHPCTNCGGGGGAVPEPASLLLLGSGLAGLITYGRRRIQA